MNRLSFIERNERQIVYAELAENYNVDDVYDLLHRDLLLRKDLIATAESCTGGMVAAELSARSGSSAYLYGGVVVYANHAKHNLLGVSPYDIRDHGAVSEEVCIQMLKGVFETCPAQIAVAVTGIAGPNGGTATKPVGTVWIGVAIRGKNEPALRMQRLHNFKGDRAEIREASVLNTGLMVLELFARKQNAIDTLSAL